MMLYHAENAGSAGIIITHGTHRLKKAQIGLLELDFLCAKRWKQFSNPKDGKMGKIPSWNIPLLSVLLFLL